MLDSNNARAEPIIDANIRLYTETLYTYR